MPRVPQYIQDRLASSMVGVPQMSSSNLSNAQVIADSANAQASNMLLLNRQNQASKQNLLNVAGEAFNNFAMDMRIRQMQQAKIEAQQQAWKDEAAVANASVQMHQKMVDQFRLTQDQNGDAKSMMTDWRSNAPLILNEMLGAPDIRGNMERENNVRKSFASLMNQYDGQLVEIGRRKETEVQQGITTNNLDSIVKHAGRSGDGQNLVEAQMQLKNLEPTIRRFFKPNEAEKMISKTDSDIVEAFTKALIDEDTQAARKALSTENWVKDKVISRDTHDMLMRHLSAKEKDNEEVLDLADKLMAKGAKQRINDLYDTAISLGTESAFQQAKDEIHKITLAERSKKTGRNEEIVNFGISRADQLGSRKSNADIAKAEAKAAAAEAHAEISRARSDLMWIAGEQSRKIHENQRKPENIKAMIDAATSFGTAVAATKNKKDFPVTQRVAYILDSITKNEQLYQNGVISPGEYGARVKMTEGMRIEALADLKKFAPKTSRHMFVFPSDAELAAQSTDYSKRLGLYVTQGASHQVLKAFDAYDQAAKDKVNAYFMSEFMNRVAKYNKENGGEVPVDLPKDGPRKKGLKSLTEIRDETSDYMMKNIASYGIK